MKNLHRFHPESIISNTTSQHLRSHHNHESVVSFSLNHSYNQDNSIIPPRLSFQYKNTSPFSLTFKINSTVSVAKKMLSPRYHVSPGSIKLYLQNNELIDTQLLRELRIPINKHIQILIEKPINKVSLLFLMQHEAYRFEFPEETTIEQIKDELMRHADRKTVSIKLLYNGLYLDDKDVLKNLHINPKHCIIVDSEMLEREDFIFKEISHAENHNFEKNEYRPRTEIITRRLKMRELYNKTNSNSNENEKIPVFRPNYPKTAPSTPNVRKFSRSKKENLLSIDRKLNNESEIEGIKNNLEHGNELNSIDLLKNNETDKFGTSSDSSTQLFEKLTTKANDKQLDSNISEIFDNDETKNSNKDYISINQRFDYFSFESEGNKKKDKRENNEVIKNEINNTEIIKEFEIIIEKIDYFLNQSPNNDISFSQFVHYTRNIFSGIFIELSDSNKNEFLEKLFIWSHEKINLTNKVQNIAGLCGLSFYLLINEVYDKILKLPQVLMKFLQFIQIDYLIASGVSYLFKQITNNITPEFSFDIKQYIEMINQSLDGKKPQFPLVSSLFMYYQSVKLNSYLLQEYSYYIDKIIKQAIIIPNTKVQKTAVKLNQMRLNFDPSAYNSVIDLIEYIKNTLKLKIDDKQAFGLFFLLSSLIKNNKYFCEDKFDEIISIFEEYFKDHSSENYLLFLSDFVECFESKIIKEENTIFSIVFSNEISFLNKIENCQNVSRIMKFLPLKLCPYINEICFNLFQDCYFFLIKCVIQIMPNIVDLQHVINSFKEFQLTSYFVDAAIAFTHIYKSEISQLIKIIIPKIDDKSLPSLRFLSEISFLIEFPLTNYWDMANQCQNKSEDFRIASVLVLNSIIQRLKQQEQKEKFFSLFLSVYDDNCKVKLAFLNSIDNSLLPLFNSPEMFFILQDMYQDEDFEVSKSALSLISRIRNISQLKSESFFNRELEKFQNIFYQMPNKKEQKKFLRLLPNLIKESREIVITHGQKLAYFLLNILNSESLHFTNLSNRINDISNIKSDIKIRIYALKSFRSLIKFDQVHVNYISKAIESITNQLFLNKKSKLHISAIKTLRTFFRLFKIHDLVPINSLILIHRLIFKFVQKSLNINTNIQVLKLLGSIGPLVFPESGIIEDHLNRNKDLYPLYSRSKREQSFLNFVMKYILDELKIKGKKSDLSCLTNAILFIFQHDSQNCLAFLDQVVDTFTSMFDYEELARSDSSFKLNNYFHFLIIIVTVVDIHILPYADKIYKLILPFLVSKIEIKAIELLNSLIFALKSSFIPYRNETFAKITSILNETSSQVACEVEDSLLLSLTLMVIYTKGSIMIYFENMIKILTRRKIVFFSSDIKEKQQYSNQSLWPLLFLGQVLYNCSSEDILIPSFRIFLYLFESDSLLKEISISLIKIMLIKYEKVINNFPLDKKSAEIVNQVKSNRCKLKSIYGLISSNNNSKSATLMTNNFTDDNENIDKSDEISKNGDNEFKNESSKTKYEYLEDEKMFLREFEPKPFINKSSLQSLNLNITKKCSLSDLIKNFKIDKDWTKWILQFTQELTHCSNSPAIQASFPLLSLSTEFVVDIFPYIIISVWDDATKEERSNLSKYLLKIANDQTISNKVLYAISLACDAMDRANFSLFDDPSDCGKIAERCNSLFLALRFYEKSFLRNNSEYVSYLLEINAILKQKEAELGLLQTTVPQDFNPVLFETLSMWSKARDIYKVKHEQDPKNESYLIGFLRCSMHLEDWDVVEKYIGDFDSFSLDMKEKVAIIYATTAQNTGTSPNEFLKVLKVDDPMFCIIHAIALIDQNKLNDSSFWINRGFALICLDMSCFSSEIYESAIQTICLSSFFEELNDIINQKKEKKTTNQVLEIWKRKSTEYVKRDATQLCYSCHLKEHLHWNDDQLLAFHFDFVNQLRKMKEWTLFDNNFNRLFKDCHDDRVILMKAKSRFDRGIVKDLSEFESIIEKISEKDKQNNVYCELICAYASRCSISPEIISKLKDVIQINPSHVRTLKLWSYFNFGCVKIAENELKLIEYASNAIQGFSKLINLTTPSLHYLCQFISIFFKYGPKLSNFKEASENLTSLTNSHVIQIIPQLLIQFSNPNEEIREIVSKIITKFSIDNFQALTIALCFMSHTSVYSNQSFNDFMHLMMNDHHQIMEEAKNFADSMVSIAITDVEKVLQLLDIVINYQHPNNHISKIKNIFNRIKSIINQPHYGYVADVLSRATVQLINNRLDENQMLPTTSVNVGEIYKNSSAHIIDIIYQKPEIYADIDINEMKIPNFPLSSLSLVVPGFYVVNENPVTIQRIFNILKTIPSQKRPRKLRIIGSNGKKYKYLLKGREDLRLDHRVMQLFSLINCILQEDKFSSQKKLQINRFPIIPLTVNAGLIAWAERGETLFSLINWYRQIIHVNNGNQESNTNNENQNRVNIEQNFIYFLFENKTDYSLKLNSIQKLELYRKLCSLSPDNDLSEALWLRSKNAEIWHSQITNFAQSNGLMSIIGYIIGIGDRHPSNILVKKDTGNVVHIDFSDVFEKANLRSFVHETVPFRLTRMLVRALGPSGAHGVFEITAQKIMSLMRKNKDTILSFLDIFVQEPITDTLWYSNFDNNMISDDKLNLNLSLSSVSESILEDIDDNYPDSLNLSSSNSNFDGNLKISVLEKAINRVNEKLNGSDFDSENLDPIKQVNKLIDIATNEMNLSQMFYGWAPYW